MPDDPTPDALMHALSMAMDSEVMTDYFRRASEPVKVVRREVDCFLPTGSGKTESYLAMIAEAKTWPQAPAKRAWYARVSPLRIAGFAVFIAGRKRAALGIEWHAHLSGETGGGLPEDRQVREAGGFLLAAIRYRFQDLVDLLWRPTDTVLASRELSNLFVLLASLGVAVVFIRQGGLNGLADNLASVAVVWGAAFGLIHLGRRWRDVKPPERKPRRTRQ